MLLDATSDAQCYLMLPSATNVTQMQPLATYTVLPLNFRIISTAPHYMYPYMYTCMYLKGEYFFFNVFVFVFVINAKFV